MPPRSPSLEGLHVVLTGAASGIGRRLATDLAARRVATLHLVDVDASGLESLAAALRGSSTEPGAAANRIETHRVDVASSGDVQALAAALGEAPLDLLINSAGILSLGPFERALLADIERVIEVNLTGAIRMTHALLPALLRSRRGFLVNIASAAGLVAAPGMTAYTASKFGLVGFSEALRAELRGRVGVCVVCPTLVKTGIVRQARFAPNEAGEAEAERRSGAEALLGRLGADPRKASRAILRAIEKRKRLVLVNLDAYAIYHLHRLMPGVTKFAVDRAYRWLQRRGVLG